MEPFVSLNHLSKDSINVMVKPGGSNNLNYLRLDADEYPYYLFLDNSDIFDEFKKELETKYDAELIIKATCYEIRKRKQTKPDNQNNNNNNEWLNKIEDFIKKFETKKFLNYKIDKDKMNLDDSIWSSILTKVKSWYRLTQNINLKIESENCFSIEGLRDDIYIEIAKIKKEIESIKTNENNQIEHHQKSLFEDYELDTLSKIDLKLLKIENFIEWCQTKIDSSLNIELTDSSVHFKGKSESIEKSKSRLWDLIKSIKTYKHQIDYYLGVYFNHLIVNIVQDHYLDKLLNSNSIKCAIEKIENSNNQTSHMIIKSIHETYFQQCCDLIERNFSYCIYDLNNEHAIELVKNTNSIFKNFLHEKEAELKKSKESDRYIISIYMDKKITCCCGEKLLVNRLGEDIKDFFDSNVIYDKYLTSSDVGGGQFNYEDIKYFQLVKQDEILDFSDQIKEALKIKAPYVIESEEELVFDNNNLNGRKILNEKSLKIKITANQAYHTKFLNFLQNLSNRKYVEKFHLNNPKMMEVFADPKVILSLENLEKSLKCAIILKNLESDLIKSNKNNLVVNSTSSFKDTKSQHASNHNNNTSSSSVNEFHYKRTTSKQNTLIDIKLFVSNFEIIDQSQFDVVIVWLNKKFQALNRASEKILEIAGDVALKYLNSYGDINEGDAYFTAPGIITSNCDNLIYAILPNDLSKSNDYLNTSTYKCLELIDQKNLEKIFLPVFYDEKKSEQSSQYKENVTVLVDTLFNYLSDVDDVTSIKEIHFVEMLDSKKFLVDLLKEKTLQNNKVESSVSFNGGHLNSPSKVPVLNNNNNNKSLNETPSLTTRLSSNLEIEIVYKSIVEDDLVCDAIVNSTSKDLNLSNGQVSTAILDRGGKSIQDELKTNYPNGLTSYKSIAVTSAGNLKNKKFIFHCWIQPWDEKNKDIAKQFEEVIFALLDEANTKKLKLIAFPAFGSGNLKYPKELVPKYMYESVRNYFNQNVNSTINKLYLVLYIKDKDTIDAFKNYLSNSSNQLTHVASNHNEIKKSKLDISKTTTTMPTTSAAAAAAVVGPTTNILKYENFQMSSKECSLLFGSIQVRAYVGDITESITDVIFNPTDKLFSMDGNVSQVLLRKGGNEIQKQLDLLVKDNANTKDFVWTSSGLLNCKNIIHVDVRTNDIKFSVIKALKSINENKYRSLTLPVIGTGRIQKDPYDSIKNILDAISNYIQLMNESDKIILIKKIEICIYKDQSNFLEYFSQNMEKKFKKKIFEEDTSIIQKIKSLFFRSDKDEIKKILETDQRSLTSPYSMSQNSYFVIVSDDKQKIQLVKQKLEEIANDEFKFEKFTNIYLNKLDVSTKSLIDNYCLKNNVKITWNSASELVLEGRLKNVHCCHSYLMDIITTYASEQEKKANAKLVAQKIQWEYKKNGVWKAFNIFLNNQIEEKYQNPNPNSLDSKLEILDENNVKYIVDVNKMTQIRKDQINDKTKEEEEIRRVDFDKSNIKFKLPDNWIQDKLMNLIDLQSNDDEYKKVLQLVEQRGLSVSTGLLKKVVSIQRIQNERLYIQYEIHKKEFEKKYANTVFEYTLFHGTNQDCVEKIWTKGFNRSYAGKNATAFGKGVYFALNSSYSHNYTDKRPGKQHGHMFVCKVLVGKIVVGNPNMNVPSSDADSTVDNITSPAIYVIYHDAQVYPEYLITYE